MYIFINSLAQFMMHISFIFLICCFPLIVNGAMEHIPACIGLKVRRHFGQAACPSSCNYFRKSAGKSWN